MNREDSLLKHYLFLWCFILESTKEPHYYKLYYGDYFHFPNDRWSTNGCCQVITSKKFALWYGRHTPGAGYDSYPENGCYGNIPRFLFQSRLNRKRSHLKGRTSCSNVEVTLGKTWKQVSRGSSYVKLGLHVRSRY